VLAAVGLTGADSPLSGVSDLPIGCAFRPDRRAAGQPHA
jgi:hypothetical protein